jgi:hypothetical protein
MWVSVEHTHRKVAYLQEHARLLGQLPLGARNREPRRPGGVAPGAYHSACVENEDSAPR